MFQDMWFDWLKKTRLDEMATRAAKMGVALPTALEELEPYVADPATHFITFTADLRGQQSNRGGNPEFTQKALTPHFSSTSGDDIPAKWEKSPARPKFGLNPRSRYNTPIGIYSYPLTPRVYDLYRRGQLPFASDQMFVTLFKPKEGLNLLTNWDEKYLSILDHSPDDAASYFQKDPRFRELGVSDDEYSSYINRLVSDEFLEKVSTTAEEVGQLPARAQREILSGFHKREWDTLGAMIKHSRYEKHVGLGGGFFEYFWREVKQAADTYWNSPSQGSAASTLHTKMSGVIGAPGAEDYRYAAGDFAELDVMYDRAFVDYIRSLVVSMTLAVSDKTDLVWTSTWEGRKEFKAVVLKWAGQTSTRYERKVARWKRKIEEADHDILASPGDSKPEVPIEPLNDEEVDFILGRFAVFVKKAQKEYGDEWHDKVEIEGATTNTSTPANSKIVQRAAKESSQSGTNLGRLWNVTREAADRDSKRWGRILRALGIDGVIDYHSPNNAGERQGFGLLHSAEPEQAVFFKATSLEVVRVFDNKFTPTHVRQRRSRQSTAMILPIMQSMFKETFGRDMDRFEKQTLIKDHMQWLGIMLSQHSLEGDATAAEIENNLDDAARRNDYELTKRVVLSIGWIFEPSVIALRAMERKNTEMWFQIDDMERELNVFTIRQHNSPGGRVLNLAKLGKILGRWELPVRARERLGALPNKDYKKYGIVMSDFTKQQTDEERKEAMDELHTQFWVYDELLKVFAEYYRFVAKFVPQGTWPSLTTVAEKHGVVAGEPGVQIDVVTEEPEPVASTASTAQALSPPGMAPGEGPKPPWVKESLDTELKDYFTLLTEEKGRSVARGVYRFFCMIGYSVEAGDIQRGLDDILADLRVVKNVGIVTVIEGNRRLGPGKYIAGIAVKFIPSVPGEIGLPIPIKNKIVSDLRRIKNVERIFRISAGLERLE